MGLPSFVAHTCSVRSVLQEAPELNTTIKMEVGIEDCLHIEFEYNQSKCVARARGARVCASARVCVCVMRVCVHARAHLWVGTSEPSVVPRKKPQVPPQGRCDREDLLPAGAH